MEFEGLQGISSNFTGFYGNSVVSTLRFIMNFMEFDLKGYQSDFKKISSNFK